MSFGENTLQRCCLLPLSSMPSRVSFSKECLQSHVHLIPPRAGRGKILCLFALSQCSMNKARSNMKTDKKHARLRKYSSLHPTESNNLQIYVGQGAKDATLPVNIQV
mmetsp:Transcript_160278/g.282758  ORF Transcript_160278/g.282758 Transcript_160278/m.282758 type:complete len:107 (-) Transcript_160278:762-1082(-)